MLSRMTAQRRPGPVYAAPEAKSLGVQQEISLTFPPLPVCSRGSIAYLRPAVKLCFQGTPDVMALARFCQLREAFLRCLCGSSVWEGRFSETFGKATVHSMKKREITAKFLLTWERFSIIIYGHATERTSSAPCDRDEPGDCSKEVTSGEYVR